jgi:lactobin A/cerein 7B family class IIb bacteriocin
MDIMALKNNKLIVMELQKINTMGLVSMEQKEMQEIDGGLIPLAVAWGICKIVAYAASGTYAVCYAVGTAHAHYHNNKAKK